MTKVQKYATPKTTKNYNVSLVKIKETNIKKLKGNYKNYQKKCLKKLNKEPVMEPDKNIPDFYHKLKLLSLYKSRNKND